MAVFPGKVAGPVTVLNHPQEKRAEKGDILVAYITDVRLDARVRQSSRHGPGQKLSIYIKHEPDNKTIPKLASGDWELPAQVKILEKWLVENENKSSSLSYIADMVSPWVKIH